MNRAQLEEIRERVQMATPGPWTVRTLPGHDDDGFVEAPKLLQSDPYNIEVLGEDRALYPGYRADCAFIAHARQDVPALLDYIEAQEKLVRLLAVAVLAMKPRGSAFRLLREKALTAFEAWKEKRDAEPGSV